VSEIASSSPPAEAKELSGRSSGPELCDQRRTRSTPAPNTNESRVAYVVMVEARGVADGLYNESVKYVDARERSGGRK